MCVLYFFLKQYFFIVIVIFVINLLLGEVNLKVQNKQRKIQKYLNKIFLEIFL
jgi:hypothetical protein